ncbi:MAG: hypothetical protein CBC13_06260 [Planctomycetia bacterium TMED53]|nr:MAG: hypothetical protein CBC13_06260 [Planctomycetia bacterium TMED53]
MHSHRSLIRGTSKLSPLSLILGVLMILGSHSNSDANPIYSNDEDRMEKNYQEKLKKTFVSAIAWEGTLEEAKKKALEKNMPIIAYFTRSYAP